MRATLLAGIMLLCGAALFGQSESTSNEITVFRIFSSASDIPSNALLGADQRIRSVFINTGRYRVGQMNASISQDDVAQLMAKLREYASGPENPPGGLVVGKETFTAQEAQRLVRSFAVVVPVVTGYKLEQDQTAGYGVELETSFTIIGARGADAIARFTIRTIGFGPSAADAAAEAAGGIAPQLAHELRSIPELHLTTEIVDVSGTTVLIERGRANGVRVGDEYSIVATRELPSGRIASERTGLLLVREVKENISYARVIYSHGPVNVGDRIERISRIGFESTIYAHVAVASEPLGTTIAPVYTIGAFETVTRGFYNLRPVLGLEIPVATGPIGAADSYSGPGLPVNVYAGAELNWRLWRFDFVPLVALGLGGILPLSTSGRLSVTLAGGLVQISASYLVVPRMKVSADIGMEQWLPVGTTGLSGWGGFYGGLGVAFNY